MAAAAAVRAWPFRVYSFPKVPFISDEFQILNPIVGQSVYVTSAAKAPYFHVGDVIYLHPEQQKAANDLGLFRVVAMEQTEMTVEHLERKPWPL